VNERPPGHRAGIQHDRSRQTARSPR